MIINPQILLDAMGGFNEEEFLSLFARLDTGALERLLRTTNAEEWGTGGSLKLEDFLCPLRTRRFPRFRLSEFDWYLDNALMPVDKISDPMLVCFVSALQIFAQAHSPGDQASMQRSLGMHFEALSDLDGLKALGFYYRIHSAKFLLWVHGRSCGSDDARHRLVLHAFLLLSTCLVDLGETVRMSIKYDPDWRLGRFVDRAVDAEANEALARTVRAVAGPEGQVVAMLKALCDEVFIDKSNPGTVS